MKWHGEVRVAIFASIRESGETTGSPSQGDAGATRHAMAGCMLKGRVAPGTLRLHVESANSGCACGGPRQGPKSLLRSGIELVGTLCAAKVMPCQGS
jgi:hypothetical protein